MGVSAKPFTSALTTPSTAADFTAQNATTTKPSGAGVFDLEDAKYGRGGCVPDLLQLIPWGTNAANDIFDMRVWGYSLTLDATPVWVPQLIIDLTATLGATTCTPFAADSFLADTLVVNDGSVDNGPWRSFIDAQEDLVASILIHTRGCRMIVFDWDLGTGAVSMNCLWRPIWDSK